MVTSTKFLLEHFYYGQLVHHGKPAGDPRLLAKSGGITDEHVAVATKQAALPPLVGIPQGAWAVVRGKQIPFLMIQSAQGSAGEWMRHYIVMPGEVLRTMGGNLKALLALVDNPMPVYETLGDKLPPLEVTHAEPPSNDALLDDLLELMTYTQNRIATIEALLSAIVQGVQIVIQGAPPELDTRTGFIEGLLALLPSSARHGVTFATHSLPDSQFDVQVRFYSDDPPPPKVMVYHWDTREFSGEEVQDDYSHFIVSQLRLDTELVIQQTHSMTAIAAWRIRQGDRLAQAMGYASHRFKLDNSVLNNQPVEITEVSKVLEEDPTLDGELRTAYAKHVLNMALALGEMEYSDPLAPLLGDNPELAQYTLQQMGGAVQDGKADAIYSTLLVWIANPQGPQGKEWVNLAHNAALFYLQSCVKAQDVDAVHAFLGSTQDADPAVQVERIAPKIIEMSLPLTARDHTLAQELFLLAMTYLPDEALKRLLSLPGFVAQLPKPLAALPPYLTGKTPEPAPHGLVNQALKGFDEAHRPALTARLMKLAQAEGRADLLDPAALLQAAQSSPDDAQTKSLLAMAHNMLGTALDDEGAKQVLQVFLALGEYREVAHGMVQQARERYPGDLQPKYVAMVQRLFAETPLSPERALQALDTIKDEGIKAVPLMMATVGLLEASGWAAELEAVAHGVAETLLGDHRYLELIPAESVLAVLHYYVERKDVTATIRIASLIPAAAAYDETNGIAIVSRMYKLMTGDERVRLAALQLLRRYVRKAGDQDSRKAVVYFGRELGDAVRQSLEITYYVNRFMGSEIAEYAHAIHLAADYLQDSASAYAGRGGTASLGSLTRSLEIISGSLPHDQRVALANHVMSIARAVVALGRLKRTKNIDGLLAGKTEPQSALDLFRLMGGYFAKGKRFTLKLEHMDNPLGRREMTFREDVATMDHVLSSAAGAFPPDKPLRLTAKDVRDELDSLWSDVSTEQQRELVRGLAIDLQRTADLIEQITDQGDAKALEEGGLAQKLDTGKQKPKSALELYRVIYSYLKGRG